MLAGAVEANGVASLVVLTKRYTPETREQLAQLEQQGGWVGGSARWLNGALLGGPFSKSPWRHERGPLDDIGPHAFDLLDATLGTITDVVAANESEHGVWQIVFRHEGGATSVATMTMALPLNPSIAEVIVYDRVLSDAEGVNEENVSRYQTAGTCLTLGLEKSNWSGNAPFSSSV